MINKIKTLIKNYNLDGYIIPKNDEFFTEYSKTNKLETIAKFTGSAGFVLILKNSNHLFVDGRYTIQAKKQSGNKFRIHEIPFVWPKNICEEKKLSNIGFDPKIFTNDILKTYFNDVCNLVPINQKLFEEKFEKIKKENLVFSIDHKIIGETVKSKINRLKKILKKNKIDNLFISSGENVCWLLNIRGKDLPNSPVANFQAILTSQGKIILLGDLRKLKNIKNELIKKKTSCFERSAFFKILNYLKGKSFCIDGKSCSVLNENLIKSKFYIKNRIDPIYDLKSIKNNIEIKNMVNAHIEDGVALTKFLYWIKNSML